MRVSKHVEENDFILYLRKNKLGFNCSYSGDEGEASEILFKGESGQDLKYTFIDGLVKDLSVLRPDKNMSENRGNEKAFFDKEDLNSIVALLFHAIKDYNENVMWIGRAGIYINALLKPLIYLRDKKGLELNFDLIDKYFIFKNTEALAKNDEIPMEFREQLLQYVENIPLYKKNAEKQHMKVEELHGYITMNFIPVFKMYRTFFSQYKGRVI